MKVNLNNVYTINGDANYIIGPSYIRRKNRINSKKVAYALDQCQTKHRQLDKQIIEYEKSQYIDEYELKSLKSHCDKAELILVSLPTRIISSAKSDGLFSYA